MAEDGQEHITAREFEQRMRALTDVITEGFSDVRLRVVEVKDELRALNSKVATQQSEINDVKQRVVVQGVTVDAHSRKLDKIDTGYRHGRHDDPPVPKVDDDAKPVTRRDVNVAVGVGIICVGGIVWLFMNFGPWVQKGATP